METEKICHHQIFTKKILKEVLFRLEGKWYQMVIQTYEKGWRALKVIIVNIYICVYVCVCVCDIYFFF